MQSPENARRPQIRPISSSQSCAKMRKINRPQPKSTLFQRCSGYIIMIMTMVMIINHSSSISIITNLIIAITSIFRLGCCPCPIQWGWQHQAMPTTGSPSISVLRVNTGQATFTDISLDTFRPCLSSPSFPSGVGKRKVCDRSDTGHGTLYMSIPSQPPAVKDYCISLMPSMIQQIMARPLRQSCFGSKVFRVWTPCFASMGHSRAVPGGQDRQ